MVSVTRAMVTGLMGVVVVWLGGCVAAGFLAAAIPPTPVAAAYKGLAGQSVGVMVWTDRSVRIDYPLIQLDVANIVQANLAAAQKDKKDDLKLTTFPVEPRSIVRFQRENPGLEARPITEVAGELGVSRLIYIEITDFQTRPTAELELFRGTVTGSVRVVEVDANGVGRIGFQEDKITVTFPKKGPPEGVLNSSDVRMYQGVLSEFATQVAWRFFTHTPPDEVGNASNRR